jgi:hypothetical protein
MKVYCKVNIKKQLSECYQQKDIHQFTKKCTCNSVNPMFCGMYIGTHMFNFVFVKLYMYAIK